MSRAAACLTARQVAQAINRRSAHSLRARCSGVPPGVLVGDDPGREQAQAVMEGVPCSAVYTIQARLSVGRADARLQTQAFWPLAMYLLNGTPCSSSSDLRRRRPTAACPVRT